MVASPSAGRVLAEDLIDPHRACGFASFIFATYELLISFLASSLVAVAGPWAMAAVGLGRPSLELWAQVSFPVMVLLVRLLSGEWVTAVLGALPVVAVRVLYTSLRPGLTEGWPLFGAAPMRGTGTLPGGWRGGRTGNGATWC